MDTDSRMELALIDRLKQGDVIRLYTGSLNVQRYKLCFHPRVSWV